MDNSTPSHTGEITPSKTVREIVKEAKRIEESTLLSGKGHFVAASRWRIAHLAIGIPNAVAAVIAGAMMLSFSDEVWIRVTAGVLSILAAGMAALQMFLNPNEQAGAHFSAGNNYDALNGRVRIFWTVECWEGRPERELTERLKELAGQKEKLNQSCPQIPAWAYTRGRAAIADGEGAYSVDKPSLVEGSSQASEAPPTDD